jgi:hypothetical protein
MRSGRGVWWRGVLALVSLGLLIGGVTGCFGGRSATSRSSVGVAASTSSSSHSGPTSSPSGTGSSVVPSPSRSVSASGYPADVPLTGLNVNPGEKPPVFPMAASGRSQSAANAFAKFFIQTTDWGYATTNSAYMKHYYGPSCGLCEGLARSIDLTAKAKHKYLGGRLTIRSSAAAVIAPVLAPADFCASLSVDETALSVVDKAGKFVKGEGANQDMHFKLCAKRSGDHWAVTYLARLS